MRKFNKAADQWLYDEIVKELTQRFNLKKHDAQDLISRSNFLKIIQSNPVQVHHDSPATWAIRIGNNLKTEELAY